MNSGAMVVVMTEPGAEGGSRALALAKERGFPGAMLGGAPGFEVEWPTSVPRTASAEDAAAREMFQKATEALYMRNDSAAARLALQDVLDRYPNSESAKVARRMLAEQQLIGKVAPPLQVASWFQGKAGFADAPVTLLVFGEAWCPHSRKELPRLAREANALRARGVQIIWLTRVTKSATDDDVRAMITEFGIPYAVAREQAEQTSQAYAVTGIPAAALVKDGVVIWRGHPARLTDTLLDTLLSGS